MTEEERRALDAARGQRLASIGGWLERGATVYANVLEYKNERFPITENVRAEISGHGNVSSVQGWVQKSHQDSRELWITVSGGTWHTSILAVRCHSTTNGNNGWNNMKYEHASNRARAFVDAVNTAAGYKRAGITLPLPSRPPVRSRQPQEPGGGMSTARVIGSWVFALYVVAVMIYVISQHV